jgi:hypothetical protein
VILQQFDQCVGYGSDLARRNKRPTYAIAYHFPYTTNICGDDRPGAS